jgi:hypothetical protein
MNTKQPDTLILELNDLRANAETASSTGWIYRDTYADRIDKCNQVIGKVNSITGLQLSPRQTTLSDLGGIEYIEYDYPNDLQQKLSNVL